MRHAYNDVGWLLQPDETEPYGFSLGYDFCAEHEFGAKYIKEALGIEKDFPIGVEDRTMTAVPEDLGYDEYELRSKDKRVKKTTPAALLYLARRYSAWPESPAERAKCLGASFQCDVKDRRYEPERHDIVSAWSGHGGFVIHVRGAQNVARLRALHEAFRRKAVSLADASGLGFIRKALSLVIVDRFPEDVKKTVRERDLAHKRMYDAFDATGVKERLKQAGRRWYALMPRWREGEGSQLLVFLNPCEQGKYDSGWFTVEELDAWAQGRGPVADGRAAERALKAMDTDWAFHLVAGLEALGIGINGYASLWTDEAKTVPGVRLLISAKSGGKFADGIYPISELMPYIERGRKVRDERKAQERAEQAAKASTPQEG